MIPYKQRTVIRTKVIAHSVHENSHFFTNCCRFLLAYLSIKIENTTGSLQCIYAPHLEIQTPAKLGHLTNFLSYPLHHDMTTKLTVQYT